MCVRVLSKVVNNKRITNNLSRMNSPLLPLLSEIPDFNVADIADTEFSWHRHVFAAMRSSYNSAGRADLHLREISGLSFFWYLSIAPIDKKMRCYVSRGRLKNLYFYICDFAYARVAARLPLHF